MRYAIYFAPPAATRLWQAGCEWLGRDPLHLRALAQPRVAGVDSRTVSALTRRPRRYGFHATLKPPFKLVAGETREGLSAALSGFARTRHAFRLPQLQIGNLGGFIALRAPQPCRELDVLAAECVSKFDRFRQQPTRAELARRCRGLDARQRELLAQWGYPYVMDQWRFHMTLTDRIPETHGGTLAEFLSRWFEPALREPLWMTDLCLFIEERAGDQLRLDARFPMTGPV